MQRVSVVGNSGSGKSWAWVSHRKYRERYQATQHDPANAHLAFVRLRSRSEAAALVASVASQRAGGRTGE
jgi:ABC-type dipeptide/oligopeptide/nickel transport system ATPase component